MGLCVTKELSPEEIQKREKKQKRKERKIKKKKKKIEKLEGRRQSSKYADFVGIKDLTHKQKRKFLKGGGTEKSHEEKLEKLEEYIYLNIIGKGSYGRIIRIREEETMEEYAMKIVILKKLKKESKKHGHNIDSLMEGQILSKINHPNIVKLHEKIITKHYCFYILDLIKGTTLRKLLVGDSPSFKFTNEQVFYIASHLAHALKYLHSKNIIYRDLKPDNVMISEDGHVKLIDFGISLEMDGCDTLEQKAGSFSLNNDFENLINSSHEKFSYINKEYSRTYDIYESSLHYMAPEMAVGEPYDYGIDWWGYGIILYYIFVRKHPLGKMSSMDYNKNLKFPKEMSAEAKDLIQKLICVNKKERLGSNGNDEVLNHPYFASVDWKNINTEQNMISPLEDQITCQFDKNYTKEFPGIEAVIRQLDKEESMIANSLVIY